MAGRRSRAGRRPWPTLRETEITNAGPREIVEMLDTAKRAAEVAVKAGPSPTGTVRDARRATLELAMEIARRALLVLDIVLEADAAERTV